MHDHHDHDHDNELDAMTARVRALETILVEKGLVDPVAVDAIIDRYEHEVGPRNGAAVVARAWTDPDFADWLKTDATAAIASMGFIGRQGEHMVAVFNSARRAQPRRMHALFLLPVAGARTAARLVQGARLPRPCGA
jgi:nitrile hydratase